MQQLTEPAMLVRTELNRLTALLDDFLNLARPRGLARQSCRVAELFESVSTLKQPLARSLGIALSSHLDDPELRVTVDPDRLKQVLINLVGNALEAMSDNQPQTGKVSMTAEQVPEGVKMCVSDNGPGVPSEIAEQAFKPFVSNKQGGTGLGLAIVHKIVSQHGGRVRLCARPDGGTAAELLIPS